MRTNLIRVRTAHPCMFYALWNLTMHHPLLRRLLWVLFAILFYQSGLAATVWLLDPEHFGGGLDVLWALAFPVLLPAFFWVNRRLGCAAGRCPLPDTEKKGIPYSDRMPGL